MEKKLVTNNRKPITRVIKQRGKILFHGDG